MTIDLAQELTQWPALNSAVTLVATAAFAVTGVLAITDDKDTDLLGAIFFGVIAAIGGGTIRDVIIDVPPFWTRDQWPIAIGAGAAVAAFYGRRKIHGIWLESALNYLDGLGAAMFAVQATAIVWMREFAVPSGPIILGVVTGIGGGLIRDTLAGRPTLLVRPDLYATPILLGCVASAGALWLAPGSWNVASLVCIAGTFGVRAAAIHWQLSFPAWGRTTAATDGDTTDSDASTAGRGDAEGRSGTTKTPADDR